MAKGLGRYRIHRISDAYHVQWESKSYCEEVTVASFHIREGHQTAEEAELRADLMAAELNYLKKGGAK
jgi:hypothetical protein